uniref:Uncharacterized protein n=1 Tax=Arundo donax TaxID=35708 RepID=A0A0A9BT32_ARUDO
MRRVTVVAKTAREIVIGAEVVKRSKSSGVSAAPLLRSQFCYLQHGILHEQDREHERGLEEQEHGGRGRKEGNWIWKRGKLDLLTGQG